MPKQFSPSLAQTPAHAISQVLVTTSLSPNPDPTFAKQLETGNSAALSPSANPIEKSAGIRESPCSPPSPCRIVCVLFSESVQKNRDSVEYSIRASGTRCSRLGVFRSLRKNAARLTWSNAPMPSKDTMTTSGPLSAKKRRMWESAYVPDSVWSAN